MRWLLPSLLLFQVLALGACASGVNDNAHTTATSIVTPQPTQVLILVGRPDWIDQLMSSRETAEAKPVLKILSPQPGQVMPTGNVPIRISASGDYHPFILRHDTVSNTEDHIHVVLDNLQYEDYYDLSKPFELRDLAPGKHTLRVFVARSWHESYKNDSAFQTISFTVSSNTNASAPGATTDQTKASAREEIKSSPSDVLAAVEPTRPLLTFNCPQGEFKGEQADPIMIDFWISNAKLKGNGGEYRIRYFIDDDDARYLDKWQPVWLKGWTTGKHTVRVELLGADQYPVKNGGYINITTREIAVVR